MTMFVPQARIKLGTNKPLWLRSGFKKSRLPQRKLKWYEFIRMPCLVPNVIGSIVGFIVFCTGAILCYIGYNPDSFFQSDSDTRNVTTSNSTTILPAVTEFSNLRFLIYIGPVLMGIGFFVLIVAVVLYCEIRERFVQNIVPKQNVSNTRKEVLYDMVIDEFRKNYFRGIEVPLVEKVKRKSKIEKQMPTLYKALSISTPALIITPEVQRKWKRREKLTPKYKRKRSMSESDAWLKTSSMPNIRPKSFKRIQRRFPKHLKFERNEIKNNELNKKLDNDINTKTNKEKPDTCFSNPAFRGSSPEPVELEDVTTSLFPRQSESVDLAQVIVHFDANSESLDTRGMTERRHSDVGVFTSATTKNENYDVISNGIQGNFKIPDIYCTDSSDETYIISKRKSSHHKSMDHLDTKQKGPYKTCIGIFRSESCLLKMSKIINKSDDDTDLLTLSEEILKIFEYSPKKIEIP